MQKRSTINNKLAPNTQKVAQYFAIIADEVLTFRKVFVVATNMLMKLDAHILAGWSHLVGVN